MIPQDFEGSVCLEILEIFKKLRPVSLDPSPRLSTLWLFASRVLTLKAAVVEKFALILNQPRRPKLIRIRPEAFTLTIGERII